MKKYIFLAGISLFIFGYISQSDIQNSQDNSLKLKYFQSSLSKPTWKLGYGGEDNQQGINEYVPEGETVEKWTKLITEQHVFKFDVKLLSKYASIIEEQLRNSSKDFKWTVIEKTENSILSLRMVTQWEWCISRNTRSGKISSCKWRII